MQTKSLFSPWLAPIRLRSSKAIRRFQAFTPAQCSICSRATDRHSADQTSTSTAQHSLVRQNGSAAQHSQVRQNSKLHHTNGSKDNGVTQTPPAPVPAPAPAPAPDFSQPLEEHDAGNLPFTLHQLHAFKTFVSSGDKQQTADLLGVTGTNVSMLLNKLEKDFDEQLLIRSKRAPLQLTPAGQLLLRYTDRMLGLCNDALTAAKDLQNVRTGTMVVGASQTTGIYLMPKLLGEISTKHEPSLQSNTPLQH